MKIIIQCSAGKNGDYLKISEDEHKILFVAHPELYSGQDSVAVYRPDDMTPFDTNTWRQWLVRYNEQGSNPYDLLRAGDLYKNPIYSKLVAYAGWNNTYILSAGWGLVRSDYLMPYYDITFSKQALSYMIRKPKDQYDDFNHLASYEKDAETETIYFFGGNDYLQLYYALTGDISGRKVIYHKSQGSRRQSGYEYIPYMKKQSTNWHYTCAQGFIDGRIAR